MQTPGEDVDVTVSEELVHLLRVGPVGMIVLDSPADRNALSRRLVAQFEAALAEAEAGARAVIVTHRGPVFCSGADLREPRTEDHPSNALFDLVGSISRPIVAVVRGPARGGGVGLAAACDIVLATESSDFGLPEVRVGIVPAKVAVPLFRRVRPGVAAALLLTGTPVRADRAREIGLVDLVTADGAVEEELQGLLSDLLAGSPAAQAAAKVVLRDDGSVPVRSLGSDDGAAAFLAGRVAPWQPDRVPRLQLPSLSL